MRTPKTTRRRIAGEEPRAEAQLRARVPDDLKDRVAAACEDLRLTESELIRKSVEFYLAYTATGRTPKPPPPAE